MVGMSATTSDFLDQTPHLLAQTIDIFWIHQQPDIARHLRQRCAINRSANRF